MFQLDVLLAEITLRMNFPNCQKEVSMSRFLCDNLFKEEPASMIQTPSKSPSACKHILIQLFQNKGGTTKWQSFYF